MNMIKVSIIGATGYTGSELIRLLLGHPEVEFAHLTSQSYSGQKIQAVYPQFNGFLDHELVPLNMEKLVAESDLVFAALPHGLSSPIAKACIDAGVKLIDLGADFRLKDVLTYESWYEVEHEAKDLIKEAVYGLPELNREKIKEASLIANPGCFPTGIVLGLKPLVAAKGGAVQSIIIDSKSGTTGAGRSAKVPNLYAEIGENFKAYNINGHRHIPEIEQELEEIAGEDLTVSFTPHLLPISRGILSTIYVSLNEEIDQAWLTDIYSEAYAEEPFVHVLAEGVTPEVKHVRGSNHCQLAVSYDRRTKLVKIISVIDNLVKGASGQAVQNMNLMYGFEETTALEAVGLNP